VEEDKIILNNITGVIPANTGVIIKADEGSYNFMYTTAEVVPAADNLLKGTTTTTLVTPTPNAVVYVLSVVDGVVGMYCATLTDGTFLNNANKAYLEIEGADAQSKALRFILPGTTGINEAQNRPQTTIYYDLQGRRVAQPKQGIYIVNGQKVFVK
jgi:hypothetical protein